MAKEPFENRKTNMHKRIAAGEPLNGQHLRSGGKVKAKVGGAISAEDKDRDGYKNGGHVKMPASGPKLKC